MGFRELTFLRHAGTDDIELRELLTLPSGTPSYRLPQALPEPRLSGFASHPTFWAWCPLLPDQPTDRPTSAALAAQTRGILPLDPPGLVAPGLFRGSYASPNSSAATAARRPGPSRPRPGLQLRAASTDLCRCFLPRDHSFFGSPWLLPGCDRDRQLRLATPRQYRHKPLGRNGTELTWRPDSVLAALGFFPYRMHGFGRSYWRPWRAWFSRRKARELLSLPVQENSRLERDMFPLTGCLLRPLRL